MNRCAMSKMFCTAVTLGTFVIAGCGGGTGTGSTSVTGVVADGYLEKAQVFLDLNNDKEFTTGEPSAVTGVDGSYTISDVDPAALKNHAIVVFAEKNVAINHEGSSATTVTDSYVLSTPPDAPKNPDGRVVITPLTTLIHNQIESNPVLDVTAAEAVVKSNLGLAAGTSLFEDFVQKKGASDEYDKVSMIAQVVATAMGNNMTAIQAAAPNANLNDVIKLIVSEVVTQLSSITNLVEESKASGAEFNAVTMATATVNIATANPETLSQNLTQAGVATAVGSFQKALGSDGFFYLDRHYDYGSYSYEYGVVKLGALGADGYALSDVFFTYTASNPTWVAGQESYSNYVLSKEGWVLEDDNAAAGTLVFNADGTATWTMKATGVSEVITVSMINVADKPIASFIAKENSPIKAEAVFPAGSEAYKMTFVRNVDYYSVWGGQNYNSSLMGITSVAQIPATFAVGSSNMGYGLYIGNNLAVKFTGTGTSGVAQFYSNGELLTLAGSWKIVEPKAGYPVFVLDVPFSYKSQYMSDTPSKGVIFAMVDGSIRQGSVEYANVPKMESGFNFNKIAFDAVLANFVPSWSSQSPIQGGAPAPAAKKSARTRY